MTKTLLAALAAVLCAASASAQSLDRSFAEAAEAAARGARAARAQAVKEDPKGAYLQFSVSRLAAAIVCANPPKEADLPENLKFYTRFDHKPVTKIPADDTASQLDDYRGSSERDGRWHFDAWSCDTQDYSFDFPMEGLKSPFGGPDSRPVKGHARIETRGHVDWEGDLDCVAWFVDAPAAPARGRH